jgi:flagellar biogenesis protein FliO
MQLTEQIGMVLVVFGLLGGLLWFAKRRGLASFPMASFPKGFGRGGGTRRLEVLERVSLTPQHALLLVRVSDRTVLIATAPSSCTLLEAGVSPDSTSPPQRDLLRSHQ